MSFEFVIWLLAFLLHAALLGRNMYVLTSLADLESDYINPFELTKRVNRWLLAEYGVQAALCAVFFLSGKWLACLLEAGVLGYMLHIWNKGQARIDTPDAFRQIPVQKSIRIKLMALEVACFVVMVYQLVGCAIHSLLTPAGRHAAHKLFREAAASVHGY